MMDYPDHLLLRGDARRIPLPDLSVDLVFGSPPYADARLYLEDGRDLGIARGLTDWVDWMLVVTAESLRVSRGAVVWVAAGKTEDRNYWPACEGLMWEWWKAGGHAYRPCYWHRVGIPGSGGDQWFRADVEYVMCFKRPGPLPWTHNTAMGHAPKWAPGGEMSNRMSDGERVNAFGVRMDGVRIGARRQNGKHYTEETPAGNAPELAVPMTRREATLAEGRAKNWPRGGDRGMNGEESIYVPPVLANPGTLIRTTVGGGQLGSTLAHESEAPFPEDLARHFVLSLCPPGGSCLDPFSGSGTTVAVAVAAKNGRVGLGMDLRMSQCRLGSRRIADGLRPRSKLDPKTTQPAAGQQTFFGDDH